MKKASIWVSIMSFSPQIGERGDLFPIRKYLDSSIFLPTSVNHIQDLMCFKYKANFNYKLHPTAHSVQSGFLQVKTREKISDVKCSETDKGG